MCKTQPHAQDPLQKPHFLRFIEEPGSSSDFLSLEWGQEKRERFWGYFTRNIILQTKLLLID